MMLNVNLPEYYGLLEVMIDMDDSSGAVLLNGLMCSRFDSPSMAHGFLEVCSPDFHLTMIFPGWYLGECSTSPVSIVADGDLRSLLQWLPIAQTDKQAMIGHLPIDDDDKTLLYLCV